MQVAIIGAGAYGTALGRIITKNNHAVDYFDNGRPDHTLEQATRGADIIIIAVPSSAIGDLLTTYPENLRSIPTIIATKGILSATIFDGFTHLSAFSGPSFAAELNIDKPTTITATSGIIKSLLGTDWLTIEPTDDIAGLFACGSLKNIYAIGSGLLGLENDDTTLAIYIEKTLAELRVLLPAFGGSPDTADLACGIGDLILTCSSSQSRNYQYGAALASDPNFTPDQTTEGLSTAQSLPGNLYRPPILQAIVDIIENHAPIDTLLGAITHDEA